MYIFKWLDTDIEGSHVSVDTTNSWSGGGVLGLES